MNDEIVGDDVPPIDDGRFWMPETTSSEKKSYERIGEDIKHGGSYGKHAAKRHAKEAIEDLFANEFPIDDPPESYERYEAEVALRHMRESVETLSERICAENDLSVEEKEEILFQCEDVIDIMCTYGQLAEVHISALMYGGSRPKMHSDIRRHAINKLSELRSDDVENGHSVMEAVGKWLLNRGSQ